MRTAQAVIACALLALLLGGCDPASTFGPLSAQWTSQPSIAPIAAKPAVVNGTVYVGSWDGNEYAFNQTSGSVQWRSYLGITQADCDGTLYTQGVTSSPWVESGIAYLGGGGSTWDALNASSGSVLWTLYTGDNSITGGHYNWSSPLVYAGHAYVGIASFCDSPLVQGELLRVNLSTHQVENVLKVVPDGQVGGTIWTNPVVDPSTNTVFVVTGNPGGSNQPYAQSVLALDAGTLAVKSHWSLPANDPTIDADFATTPVLFSDAGGRALIAVTNKNGMLYAFQRSNLSAGPVWQTQIALSSNTCDGCAGSYSTGVFDGTRLYYAAGQTYVGGTLVGGSVRAIDPTTGGVLWLDALPAQVYGALAAANGMVAVPSSDGGLYVVSASTGTIVYANALAGTANAAAIFAAPTIAGGQLFIGTTNGTVHAFAFPPYAGYGARLRAARASWSNESATARCAGTPGREMSAQCRLSMPAAGRCARLGRLPAGGPVTVEALTARLAGSRSSVTLRLFAGGSCAGRPIARVDATRAGARERFEPPLALSPGAVISGVASRAVHLDVRVVARRAVGIVSRRLPLAPPGTLVR